MADSGAPLARRRLTGVSIASSVESESSAFWSEAGSASPSSIATSVFSSSPCSPGRSYSADLPGRRPRANTAVSFNLQSLTEYTSNESLIQVETGDVTEQPSTRFEIISSGDSPAELDAADAVNDDSDPEDGNVHRRRTSSLRPKLSRFLSKGRDRAFSLSRPPLHRSPASTLDDNPIEAEAPITFFRSKRLRKLQGRNANSAPVSPALTPCPSTDRLGFFRPRPTSIFASSSTKLPDYTSPGSLYTSPLSSCAASTHLYADHIHITIEAKPELEVEEYEDALPTDLFDKRLPREIKLRIMAMVVQTCIDDHRQVLISGHWTAARAGRDRWVGEAKGLRELIKLSGVSRAWRDLAFDGQLWQSIRIGKQIGLASFSPAGLVRLFSHAGPFLTKLDLRGVSALQGDDLETLTDACSAYKGTTRLQYINLTGCNAVSSKSLHYLLAHSPSVEKLVLRGLPAVTGSTCDVVIAGVLQDLRFLDVSMCKSLLASSLLEMRQPRLQHLLAASLPSMDPRTVSGIPVAFPLLESLDIGYCQSVTDEAFRSWSTSISLKALRLSGCSRLTDQTCLSLTGKVLMLESLELANIGPNLRDAGIVKLLESCLHLRKIDLEDASSLTDRVVAALTPAKRTRYHTPPTPLRHAVFTNIPELSEAALVRLVRACPNMRVLQCANSNHASDALAKAFIQHVKRNKVQGAEINLVDCRSVTRQAFRESSNISRPRRGTATYDNRYFEYLDAPHRNLAECDDTRIVVHSFWSWQKLDEAEANPRAVRTAQLALEAGVRSPAPPAFLRHARRASSFAFRSTSTVADQGTERRSGSSCIIS